MKMLTRKLLFGFIALAATATLFALSKAAHPKREQVASVWIGFTEDDLSFFRLTLLEDGRGYCTSIFVDQPARLYEVHGWDLNEYTIKVNLHAKEGEAEPIWMKGSTTGWKLDLEIGGMELKWKRNLKLYRESEIVSKIERSRDRLPTQSSLNNESLK